MKNLASSLREKIDKLSLQSKFITLILIILIPTLVTTLLMSLYIKNIMISQTEESVESTVTQVSESIDEFIKNQSFSIASVVRGDLQIYDLLITESTYGKVQKYVDAITLRKKISSVYDKLYQNMQLAAIVGKNGVVFNLKSPSYENEKVIHISNEIKEKTRNSGTNICWYGLSDNVFTSRSDNNPRQDKVIIAAMNIFMPNTGEYVGVQIYTIPEELIFDKYKNTLIGESGSVFIINNDGNLLSSNDKDYILGNKNLDEDFVKRIISKPDSKFIIQNSKDEFVYAKMSLLNSWITIGKIPTSLITRRIDNIFNIFWLVILLCAILCMLGFIFLSGTIMKPIKNLIGSIQRFESGEMKSYVEANGKSEISLLMVYYNRMIDKINSHIVYEYELDKQKKQLELDVLMSQINSHFLSNTLESIVWKARSTGTYDVADMASSLGRFFKLSSSKGNVFVMVADEIAHINAYVSIQKIRHGNKFDFSINVDTDNTPNIESLLTLKVLLQPLVENSIMHSFEGVEGIVHITVNIYTEKERLIFEVTDTGCGIPQNILNDILKGTKKKSSIGLRNVRERIRLYFEDEYPDCDILIESKLGHGTRIKVILPIINA